MSEKLVCTVLKGSCVVGLLMCTSLGPMTALCAEDKCHCSGNHGCEHTCGVYTCLLTINPLLRIRNQLLDGSTDQILMENISEECKWNEMYLSQSLEQIRIKQIIPNPFDPELHLKREPSSVNKAKYGNVCL